MFLRLLALLLILAMCNSCDFMSPGKTALQNKVAIDTVINYNSVDTYPLFLDCNNCDSSEKQNLCFEMELLRQLHKTIAKTNVTAGKKVSDTVQVEILVDTEGRISIVEIRKSNEIDRQLPGLDSLLHKGIASLPPAIQPSLKRGIPVNSMFTLPVVLSSKNQ